MAAQTYNIVGFPIEWMCVGLFGRGPEYISFQAQLNYLGKDNGNLVNYANMVVSSAFGTTPDAQLASTALSNMLGSSPLNSRELNNLVTNLLADNPQNRGVVICQLGYLLSGMATELHDEVSQNAASAWNARIQYAWEHSIDPNFHYPIAQSLDGGFDKQVVLAGHATPEYAFALT